MGSPSFADRIELRDVQLMCRIGIEPGESDREQPLRLSLAVELDLQQAALRDDSARTVDYCWLASRVREVVQAGPYGLLEALAARILSSVLVDDRIREAKIELFKERRPLGEGFGPAAVVLRRRRGELA